jgi:hypothetical protein
LSAIQKGEGRRWLQDDKVILSVTIRGISLAQGCSKCSTIKRSTQSHSFFQNFGTSSVLRMNKASNSRVEKHGLKKIELLICKKQYYVKSQNTKQSEVRL